MGFATEPPFCTAYPLSFSDRDVPAQMTFWHAHNHPWSFTIDTLLVRQLLARDCSPREYALYKHGRRILIPRGVHFSTTLIPEIVVPRGHAAPYCNPWSGVEAPFFTMGPFASTDTLFPGTPGDLDLYTDMEISGLKTIGLLEPSIARTRDPHTSSASKAETALSIKKRDRDSPRHRCPVSAVAGSHEDLNKSEHERDAACKRLHSEISADRGQSVSKDMSRRLKRSGTVEADVSTERPHSKEHRTERGRSREHRRPNSPERPLPPSYLFTPAAPSHPIRGSVSVPSVDPSRGSSPPAKDAGTEISVPTEVPLSSVVHQVAQSSGQIMNVPVGPIVVTSRLNAAQAEEIFLLSREVQSLRGKLALDFVHMSHTEANFRMGAQATSHEYTVQEHPSTGRRGAATQRTGEETWLHINSLLFRHTIDHQGFMVWLINRSQEAIQTLHDRIWEVVRQVMESAGKSAADSLGIALHLVSMLRTIPLEPASIPSQPSRPGILPGHSLTHPKAVLGEELVRDPTGGVDTTVQASSRATATDTVSTRFATVQGTGNDHPSANFSPHSPKYSPSRSPFRSHRSRLTGGQSNLSDSSVLSLDSSIPDESSSDTESSLNDSDGRGRSRPNSPDVVLLGNTEDDGLENDIISQSGFSKSDTKEVCVGAVREKACRSDVLYAAWLDDQIHKGNDAVKRHDLSVHDHPIFGKRCEAPDYVGPPISYMEERRVFKPAESINNPRGLCRFYHTGPGKDNVLVGPKSAASARRIHLLIEMAKGLGRQLTVVVFEGESVTPTCLLGELHSRMALSPYAIHTPDEAKIGIRNRIYCCPICAYVIKNGTTLLDHIVVGHYWGSFSRGRCLAFATHTAAGIIAHLIGCGQSDPERPKARPPRKEARKGSKSGRKSMGKNSKEGTGTKEKNK